MFEKVYPSRSSGNSSRSHKTIHTEHYEGMNSDSAGGDGEVRADLRGIYKAELTRVGMVAMRRAASRKTQVTDFGTREETEKEEETRGWR